MMGRGQSPYLKHPRRPAALYLGDGKERTYWLDAADDGERASGRRRWKDVLVELHFIVLHVDDLKNPKDIEPIEWSVAGQISITCTPMNVYVHTI